MRIILINTSFKDIYGYERMFPLGLGYIAAVLIQDGHTVLLFEPQLDNMDDKKLISEVSTGDLVGITAVTPTFPEAARIASVIKAQNPKARIILGGTHASCFPEEILVDYPEFDFVIFGEGEDTMRQLCQQIAEGALNFAGIDGLCFRDGKKVVRNKPRDYIVDLDSLPLPARQLVDLRKYSLPLHITRGKKSASMITSRGCPARCTFCSSKVTMGDRFRSHSCDYVIKEIEDLIQRYGTRHIQFVDDTFTLSAERTRQICKEIMKRKIKFEWHCFARVETVTEELLYLMKKAGCGSILFGIESADENILKNIKKGISLEKARQVHRICRKVGITTLSSFILGNPGETKETMAATINFALQLKPTFALFYRLVPYPGSEAYHKYKSENRLRVASGWRDFAPKGEEMVFNHENLLDKELGFYIAKAYKKFYLRPANLFRIAVSLNTFGQWKAMAVGLYSVSRQILKWEH